MLWYTSIAKLFHFLQKFVVSVGIHFCFVTRQLIRWEVFLTTNIRMYQRDIYFNSSFRSHNDFVKLVQRSTRTTSTQNLNKNKTKKVKTHQCSRNENKDGYTATLILAIESNPLGTQSLARASVRAAGCWYARFFFRQTQFDSIWIQLLYSWFNLTCCWTVRKLPPICINAYRTSASNVSQLMFDVTERVFAERNQIEQTMK